MQLPFGDDPRTPAMRRLQILPVHRLVERYGSWEEVVRHGSSNGRRSSHRSPITGLAAERLDGSLPVVRDDYADIAG